MVPISRGVPIDKKITGEHLLAASNLHPDKTIASIYRFSEFFKNR